MSKKKIEQAPPAMKMVYNRNHYRVELFHEGRIIVIPPMCCVEIPEGIAVSHIKGLSER